MYKTFSKDKPIKYGLDIYSLCDRGKFTKGFLIDDIPYAGTYTYEQIIKELDNLDSDSDEEFEDEIDPLDEIQVENEEYLANDKPALIVQSFIHRNGLVGSGRMIVLDNKFISVPLLEKAAQTWNVRMAGTFKLNRKFKPKLFDCKYKKWFNNNHERGQFVTYQTDKLTLNVWKDSKAVFFLDNDIKGECKTFVERKIKGQKEKQRFEAPMVCKLYNKYMGLVDACNQCYAALNIDPRSKRKQNRLLMFTIGKYALNNGYILWVESTHL